MKDRILRIMEHEGISPSKFAEEIGIQRSAMSHIISGRNNPSLDVLTKIMQRFTYVDTDWLLFGKGSMVKNGITKIEEPNLFRENEINPPLYRSNPNIASTRSSANPKLQQKTLVLNRLNTKNGALKM